MLRELFESGGVLGEAEAYIAECYGEESVQKRGRTGRFPNLAGFCRRLGASVSYLVLLGNEYPELYGALLSVFEDEALNSSQSPTLLSAYMKERLSFGEKRDTGSLFPVGDVQLIFEHDIGEDGK